MINKDLEFEYKERILGAIQQSNEILLKVLGIKDEPFGVLEEPEEFTGENPFK